MRITHDWNDNRVTIRVEGLTAPVRALMMTDLHMGLIDERDAEKLETFAGHADRFHTRHGNDADGAVIPQETAFAQMLEVARDEPVDLLALVGDWALESLRENLVEETPATAHEFVRLVSGAEYLVTILTGHCHFRHVDAISPWAAQYMAPPGYAGEYWLFEWQPL